MLRDEAPSILRQVAQDFEGLRPQNKVLITRPQTTAPQIEREAVEMQHSIDSLLHFIPS